MNSTHLTGLETMITPVAMSTLNTQTGVWELVWASLVAQLVKNPPAMQEAWVRSMGWDHPLEKGTATQYSGLENSTDCVVHGGRKESNVTECLLLAGSIRAQPLEHPWPKTGSPLSGMVIPFTQAHSSRRAAHGAGREGGDSCPVSQFSWTGWQMSQPDHLTFQTLVLKHYLLLKETRLLGEMATSRSGAGNAYFELETSYHTR